jgi:hypothetical protein
METKNLFKCITIAACIFTFASCKKDSSGSTSTSPSAEAQTQADDQTFYNNETGYATDDANAALNNNGGSYNERPTGIESPALPFSCDASVVTVDTTTVGTHSITINYSGSACGVAFNHKRTGSIIISFSPNPTWGKAGSSITITFNLKTVRVSDGKTFTITGTRTIINTTGGLLKNFSASDSVGYSITDNTTILFDNGKTRTWQTSLHRTYTNNGVNLGQITTVGSLTGTNRFGNSFSADITEPLVVEGCSGYRYTSGQVTYTGGAGGTSTTTFGLDTNGNPVTGCITGALYYKFVWTGPNNGSLTYKGSY